MAPSFACSEKIVIPHSFLEFVFVVLSGFAFGVGFVIAERLFGK